MQATGSVAALGLRHLLILEAASFFLPSPAPFAVATSGPASFRDEQFYTKEQARLLRPPAQAGKAAFPDWDAWDSHRRGAERDGSAFMPLKIVWEALRVNSTVERLLRGRFPLIASLAMP